MKNLRKYGNVPYTIAVIHGGPGAPGEMAPVAQELSSAYGVLEPLQTKDSVDGQVQELMEVLRENARLPITLIGFSWGAMLSFIFTAQNPKFVEKLILIGSGVFQDKYAVSIMNTRLSRLNEEDRKTVLSIMNVLNNPEIDDKNALFARFGKLIFKADSYNSIQEIDDVIEFQFHVFNGVWEDAERLRRTGALLELGKLIKCPVVAIHGDFDPHPLEGVKEPLSEVLNDFRFILLENCGHRPWLEKEAKEGFYRILKKELL